MKLHLYPRLAWDSIRKNRRLYTPYLLTCAGMVMMFYIIHYLAAMPALKNMPGGRSTVMVLGFGTWIVALFALLFLFYTHSFLIRRRQREFGLYNILGMGKGNLSVLLLWETGIVFAIALAGGLFGGVLLSKLAELGLLWVLGGPMTYALTIAPDALGDTVLVFALIFLLILAKGLWQLRRMSAVALLKSESAGEKPPRANYLLGIAGALILALAYYIAVSIQSPLTALAWFFIAVGLVIVATYLLFIAGSVVLCRLLQKNKSYYYRKNHFVSVSSMAYRMKRNGAGLASICILSTMVLVMMLGAGSLFFGAEDSLHARYPSEIGVQVDFLLGEGEDRRTPAQAEALLEQARSVLTERGIQALDEERYCCVSVPGLLRDGQLSLDPLTVNAADLTTMENVCNVYFVPLADYNRSMGTSETLAADEVLLHTVRFIYTDSTIAMADGTVWTVKQQVEDMLGSGSAAMDLLPTVFLVVPDLERAVESVDYELRDVTGQCSADLVWNFNTGLDPAEQVALKEVLLDRLVELSKADGGFSFSLECREAERSDFYGTYGGIFYLGILLSIVFLAATVLIIYYKQVTEGYEDEGRFAIMRKVGMTAQDIRKSVNSQMLTVFFLPLVTAAVHTAFAFPMVQKLLAMFNMRNVPLMLTVLAVTVLAFGICYAAIYKATSNAYFSIVSGRKER